MRLEVRERLFDLAPRHAYHRWRDEIVRRAARLAMVRDLREFERATIDGRLRRRLQWALEFEIPLVARAFVPEDALLFELAEAWDEERLDCAWSLRSLGVPADAVGATGRMAFSEGGLLVEGEVQVDPAAMPQMARATAPALEQAVARAIEHGYRQLAHVIA